MIRLVTALEKDRDLLWNINQKYLYEMTNYYDDTMDENGNYHYGHFDPGFSEKHDEHRLKPHKMDIPRHNYLFQMRDDKSSSKSLFYGISYDIIVTFSRIQV